MREHSLKIIALMAAGLLPLACSTTPEHNDAESEAIAPAENPDDPGTVPLPAVDSGLLSRDTFNYDRTVHFPGGDTVITRRRTLVDAGDGRLEIAEEVDSDMGAGEVHVVLDADTLLPIEGSTSLGPLTIEAEYGTREVTGKFSALGEEESFTIELQAPAFAYGTALQSAVAALPLAVGYRTVVRFVEVGSHQRVRVFDLAVAGQETVEVPAGSFNAWRVELNAADGLGRDQTLWITTEVPRYAVRSEGKLPPAMNHAPFTTVLTKRKN